ncbi:CRTAC1 family protein [uncultured Dokdonia sp.]|uniref:CRTAC1 family protein n=1 Tax=uncultured Dokdonia sp. TaxID=575653 RepID=UPI0026205A89|nr:CRTAC1 family protein [uncultured Dokdonia sp.]
MKTHLFSYVSPSHSQITFENTITENDTINAINFQYCYNGGGVGIGDFNNDGLSDIVFTGNQVPSALYLNLGEMKFKDITIASGVLTNTWTTGVSIVDINADGYDDIYINVGGANCNNDCPNLLYINKGITSEGIPTFEEKAAAYGLNDGNYSQQTLFFDYDSDHDLDAYIVRNGNTKYGRNNPIPKDKFPDHLKDVLLENKSEEGSPYPIFEDVSKEKGITHKGFGLGIAITDYNNDLLPDIYITNDFITNDVLYINQGDVAGYAFAKADTDILTTQTYNAMGVDIADINNDAFPDIAVVDMLPNDYERQKKMLGFNNYDKFLLSQRNGYTPQYVQNTLQIHNGVHQNVALPASEVGYKAGIAKTDWSWAPLIADYDRDGNKDLYITNGYVKDITDLDFINYSGQNNVFGTQEARAKKLQSLVNELPGIYLPNFMFKNTGDISFEDVSEQWMAAKDSFSNGAAYADLDGDGDLDIIVNNINAPAFVLENHADKNATEYVRIQLKGAPKNKAAIGTKITIWQQGTSQTHYQSVVRGYLSSVESTITFGINTTPIDSLEVIWPDGKRFMTKDIVRNATTVLSYLDTATKKAPSSTTTTILQKRDSILSYNHTENPANDFINQSLLPLQFNANGPIIISGNIDGLPGDELFIGGNSRTPSQLLKENKHGSYDTIQTFTSNSDVTAALFVDIDQDKNLDLYIGYGGTDARDIEDYILLNDGKGNFVIPKEVRLPKMRINTTSVTKVDYDQDGDDDLFVSGGVLAGNYPLGMESYLLENKNKKYHIVDTVKADSGFLKNATWADLNTNGTKELITVGHWNGITSYTTQKNKLEQLPLQFKNENGELISMNGWWNSIETADIDNDGDTDILLGNQGTNGFIKPTQEEPVYVYARDFDSNGSIDPVLAQYFSEKQTSVLKPIHTRDDIFKQLVSLKKRYGTYNEFAKVDFKTLLKIKDLDRETFNATTFESVYAENIGNNTFIVHVLPLECQHAPIQDILIQDIDQDGYKDVLLTGNDYSAESNYGRHDALIGVFLKGGETGFSVVRNQDSGFIVPKQSNYITTAISQEKQIRIIATQHNDKACVFEIN